MNDIGQFIQVLDTIDVQSRAIKRKAEVRSILRAIVNACRERNSQELDRQTRAFLDLTCDPANIFLGFTPEPSVILAELYNEIENKTLAMLERIAASESNG